MATSQFVAPSRHLISAEAFQRMGDVGILGPADRVELIAGEIIDMSPIGVMHAAIVEPGESLVCSGVVDDAGACVVVELARLLPPGA